MVSPAYLDLKVSWMIAPAFLSDVEGTWRCVFVAVGTLLRRLLDLNHIHSLEFSAAGPSISMTSSSPLRSADRL